jgi:hypothetical protein
MKWFGRDPAVILSIASAALSAVVAFQLGLSEVESIAIMAVLYAASDLITAFVIRSDKQLAAVVGLAEAIFTLLFFFGFEMSTEQIAALMGVITVTAGAFIRTQVEAPIAATTSSVRIVR